MIKQAILEYEATYIIYGNKTMDEVAKALNISTRTLQLHINKELKESNPELYQKVRDRLDEITKKRIADGGKRGKRKTSYDLNRINSIADDFIENFKETPMSLKELSEKNGIPQSTLYELFMKYLEKEKLAMVKSVFEYNNTIGKSNKSKNGRK